MKVFRRNVLYDFGSIVEEYDHAGKCKMLVAAILFAGPVKFAPNPLVYALHSFQMGVGGGGGAFTPNWHKQSWPT